MFHIPILFRPGVKLDWLRSADGVLSMTEQLGLYFARLSIFEECMGGARSFSVAAAVDAILWMITTGIAMAFILNGKVQQHRQWMTRSFAVAIVFLEVCVVLGVTGLEKLGGAFDETVVWLCLAFSLLLADVVLQLQEPFAPTRFLQEPRPMRERLWRARRGLAPYRVTLNSFRINTSSTSHKC